MIKSGREAWAFVGRGLGYSRKGDYDRAIADYNQAINLDPRYALAYNNRGHAYLAKGDKDRAIADFNQAIKINPLPASNPHVNVYFNRGIAYSAKGDYERAIDDYTEAIRLDPKFASAYDNRGIAYRPRATTTAPSPTTPRRSGSIRKLAAAYLQPWHRVLDQGR